MSSASKSKKEIEPDRQFLTAIHEASLLSSRMFNQAVKDVGLTRTQWMVVYRLYLEGEQSQTEIARSLSLAKPPLGKVIDLLEKDGWLTRKQNPNDRRENLISLTKKVEPLIDPLTRTVTDISRQALAGTTRQEQETFDRVLKQIISNLRNNLEF
jgi:MarR family transcriptional regulator, transcriptional regulator for hemolysin